MYRISVSTCLVISHLSIFCFFFFFNDTATTEIYTLSLHDALPILIGRTKSTSGACKRPTPAHVSAEKWTICRRPLRSEEHTSELQSRLHLVCRLLLEKKKKQQNDSSTLTYTMSYRS